MKCKHYMRESWVSNISKYSDTMIISSVRGNRKHFAPGVRDGEHNMQAWRQIYVAEARRRGLNCDD